MNASQVAPEDAKMGLHLLPEHMHDAVAHWLTHHQPEPRLMGAFLRAVLCDELVDAYVSGDVPNRVALANWANWLHNYAPARCWGSLEALQAWHDARPVK
jgi:hypothetical protein